jgi:hypothetical protein
MDNPRPPARPRGVKCPKCEVRHRALKKWVEFGGRGIESINQQQRQRQRQQRTKKTALLFSAR